VRFRWAAALGLLAISCSGPATQPPAAAVPGQWLQFEGALSATGTRQTLQLEPGHQVSTFRLSGWVLLGDRRSLGVGFRAEAIGLSDSVSGGLGRVVWTDDRGDQIFSELRGGPIASGVRATGTLVGGTGRYAGITGEYELRWRWMIQTDEGTISGRTESLRGRAKLAAAPAR